MKGIHEFINRICRFLRRRLLYILSLLLRLVVPIKKKQVIFWADGFNHYGCNPKYISEYLSENNNDYSLIWAFKKGTVTRNVKKARIVYFGTLDYLYAINSSEFIITNQRIASPYVLWKKKRGQKYIMTWHGSNPLKMIMADATKTERFKKLMMKDSFMCDLMLSDSDWYTNLVRSSFWYNGEILQKGIPRNDIFFNPERILKAKIAVCESLNIDPEKPIVLYAPTFRDNKNEVPYISEWEELKKVLKNKFDDDIQLIVRLHPNMLNSDVEKKLLCDKSVINATYYDDMQEILCSANLLITDYSSCMFEISMLHKPCFLYTPDINTYERDFYFSIKDLPFPVAYDFQGLINNLTKADFEKQIRDQYKFLKEKFEPVYNSNATKAVVEWMNSKLI